MKILSVLIEYRVFSLNTPFSYVCDDNVNVNVGCRVYVPFGHQNIVGYIIKIEHTNLSIEELSKKDGVSYKYIYKVLDEKPILDDNLYKLAKYMENEYVSPLISCLQTILPPSLKPTKSSLKEIKYKQLKTVKINENFDISLLKKTQLELYNKIKEAGELYYKDLPRARVVLLEKLNAVVISSKTVIDDYFKDYVIEDKKTILNDEQQNAYDNIINGDHDVYLLQGVTGSGKTEVYLKLVEYYVKQNKSAIVLVPEISLTPMIISRFKAHFKDIAILHGKLTNKEKEIKYNKIKNNEVKVIIGARSAIFAPVKDLGIIILDEEQSTSYKQDNMPAYHARDIAIYRAKDLNAKVVLGSATPSFETKARALKGVYKQLYINKRANNHPLPKVSIVNMRDDISEFSSLISNTLDAKIKETLNKGEKVIILQNRRGYSPYVSCRKCGYTFKCPKCELSMSYHKKGDKFKCHYCNTEIAFTHRCPSCDGDDFLFMGSGTQKIEEVIEQNYPNAILLRMDNDTTNIKNGHFKILEKFQNEDYNILLGTQMVAKGLDFEDVTLVGVIDADITLVAADFRCSESCFELLSQVAGRAGRGNKEGEVIIQTYQDSNYAINMAAHHEYEMFFKKDMLFRKKLNYPPFAYMSSITILCEKGDQAVLLADKIGAKLKLVKEFEILGPSVPYVFKENDKYRIKILVKSKNHNLIRDAFKRINVVFLNEAIERKCNIVYDIDTYKML